MYLHDSNVNPERIATFIFVLFTLEKKLFSKIMLWDGHYMETILLLRS